MGHQKTKLEGNILVQGHDRSRNTKIKTQTFWCSAPET